MRTASPTRCRTTSTGSVPLQHSTAIDRERTETRAETALHAAALKKTTGPVVRKLMPSSARGLWCYSRLREPGRSTSRSSRQLELPGQAGMARLRRSSKRSNLPEAGAEPHRSLCSHKRTGRRPSASCRSNDGHTKGMSGWRSVASRHPLHERRLKTAPNAGEQHKNRRDDQERQ